MNNQEKQLASAVKLELPKAHMKYLKKFRGFHNFINKFIYIPDVINGGDSDNFSDCVKNTCAVGEFLSSESIDYTLIGIAFDKSMHLTFRYLFQEKSSGLCSIANLVETTDGWEVKKIESFI